MLSTSDSPQGFRVLVAEHSHGRVRQVLLGSTVSPCAPADLNWSDIALERQPVASSSILENVLVVHAGNVNSALGSREYRAWLHWPAPNSSGYFLAFVNQKGSCSMRKFDARTGELMSTPEIGKGGKFEENFSKYFSGGKRLWLRRQPNLENQSRPALPSNVLEELQAQIVGDTN